MNVHVSAGSAKPNAGTRGSSILMGERAGPVRVIRETWGADSGTNVVRREIFYRDEIRLGAFLRRRPARPASPAACCAGCATSPPPTAPS